jgi:hypothetical protein
MRKGQRYRFEMFIRVRDFGTANSDLFPASSKGGQTFAQVTAAVTAIEEHLTKRDLARVDSRRVKATTRAAVTAYMKTIAHTARRATLDEPTQNPFVLPAKKTAPALLSKARLFIEDAKPREAKFVELGLPPTFISEFSALVDELHAAVNVRNNGRAWREKAQTGLEKALVDGFEAIRNLDVIVPTAPRDDPVRVGHWRGARRLEGIRSSGASTTTAAADPAATPPEPSPADRPSAQPAGQPAAREGRAEPAASGPALDEALGRAS